MATSKRNLHCGNGIVAAAGDCMTWLTDPRIFLIATTALFAAGALAHACKGDMSMAGYNACAAGLQICVMMGSK